MHFCNYQLIGNSLSYKYDNKHIFSNISFSIKSGDIVIIKGPNGSGKSTLLSVILGYQRPLEGNVFLSKNNSIEKTPIYNYSNILYINIYNTLDSHLSVNDNLNFWSNYYGYSFFLKSGTFESNVQNLVGNQTNALSTGQEKKVNLSQLFFNYAPIWILDEPFIALDYKYRAVLLNYIEIHRRLGGIVVMTSHLDFFISDAKYVLL